MKKTLLFLTAIFTLSFLFADPFNSKLTQQERSRISKGEVLRKQDVFKQRCIRAFGSAD